MTHTVQVGMPDYFAGTILGTDQGRNIRKWLRQNVTGEWEIGVFEVHFADEGDATLFRIWLG